MRSFLRTNNEVVLGVQNAHKEHKASMEKMLRQVSQLADSLREMKGNLGRLSLIEHVLEKAKESEITLKSEALCKEPELKMTPGEYEKVKDVEDALAEESNPDEAELVAKFQREKAFKKDSKEATEAPDGGMKKKEPIDTLRKPEATLFCLQTRMVSLPGENAKGLTSGKVGEDPKQGIIESETPFVHAEIPPPVINKQEGCTKKRKYHSSGPDRRRYQKSSSRNGSTHPPLCQSSPRNRETSEM